QANSRLKQIEREHDEKIAKSSQMVSELQASITSVRDESGRQQLATERKLQDKAQKCESEKRQLIKDNEKAIKVKKNTIANNAPSPVLYPK
ncbi:hypothetical protein FKM82_007893, partial [Ascaphus truei]